MVSGLFKGQEMVGGRHILCESRRHTRLLPIKPNALLLCLQLSLQHIKTYFREHRGAG